MNQILININKCTLIRFREPYESTRYFIQKEVVKTVRNKWLPWKKKTIIIPEYVKSLRSRSNKKLTVEEVVGDHKVFYREGDKMMVRASIYFLFDDNNDYEKHFFTETKAKDEFDSIRRKYPRFKNFIQ